MQEQPPLALDGQFVEPFTTTSRAPGVGPQRTQQVAVPDPSYASAPAGDFTEQRHLYDYVRIVYRRRWLVLIVFLSITTYTAYRTYRQVPIYHAKARVVIQAQRENYGFREATATDNTDFQTQLAVLRSRSLIKKTMQSLGIWHDNSGLVNAAPPPPAPPPPQGWRAGVLIARKAAADLFGIAPPPTHRIDPAASDESAADIRQIDGFAGGLSPSPVPGTGIIDIGYNSGDPVLAARYANAVARVFVDQNLELKSNATKDVSQWLADRIVEQRAKVTASEQALQQYRETHGIASLDQGGNNPVVQALGHLTGVVTRAKTDRLERETAYNQVRALEGNLPALASFPAIASIPAVQTAKNELTAAQRQLSEMSEKFGDRHPDLINTRAKVKAAEERLTAEVLGGAEHLRRELENAKITEANLTKTFEDQKGEALSTNTGGVELSLMVRELESNRQVLQTMEDRARDAGISGEIKTNNMRVLDVAEVPSNPISPQTRRDMQYGVFGGLVLSIGLAFLLEYLDNRIKSPDEIRSHLGIAFLGLLPMAAKLKGSTTPLLSTTVPPQFSEAFRGLRTNVLFSMPEEGCRTVLVASAGPGEGKTVVACNLAIALAQAGQRVIVVDCDLRRPRVHEVFTLMQEPGLSNLIVGDAKASEMIRTAAGGVTVLPAGRIPPNPAELLGSKRFQNFLTRLAERFDWIVLDSPPVMAVTDACVLAHLASGVIFVTSAEKTNKHAARAAVEQLQATRAHVLGAVLNRVDVERNPYYYSRYYRREYGSYHQS